MNYINLGFFSGKLLHIIGFRYINNNLGLELLNNNNEYCEVTLYDKDIKLSDGYLLLNPNMSDDLKKFLIKKNIFKIIKRNIGKDNLEIAIINKNVYDKLINLKEV